MAAYQNQHRETETHFHRDLKSSTLSLSPQLYKTERASYLPDLKLQSCAASLTTVCGITPTKVCDACKTVYMRTNIFVRLIKLARKRVVGDQCETLIFKANDRPEFTV
jgi:hypothetical protein